MKITLNSNPEIQSAGKYDKMTVQYQNSGRDSTKTLVSFGDDKPAFDLLRGASAGQSYEVTVVSKGKYSNWTAATKLEGEELPPSRPRSNKTWESDEDRQMRIMRQSCLRSASTFYNGKAGEVSEQAVIATAEIFYKWVTSPVVPAGVMLEHNSIDEVI